MHTTTTGPAAGTIRAEGLQPGAKVGFFVVRRASPGRLTLRGSRGFAVKAFTLGGILILIGLCAWASVARGDARQQHVNGTALIAPVVGVLCMLAGFLQIGKTWELDAVTHTLVILGTFGHRVLRPGSFKCVRLTALPTNIRQRETLVLELVVSDWIGYPVGRVRTSKPQAEHLVTAAAQLAEMLQLPLEIVGSLESARPETLARFEQLPAAGPRPLDQAA
jgi:hypothetical protein